jgi:hypothetical protein
MLLQLADVKLDLDPATIAKIKKSIAVTVGVKISMVSIVVDLVGDVLEVKCELGLTSKKVEAPMLMVASVQAHSFFVQIIALLEKEDIPVTGCEFKNVKAKEKGQKICKSGQAPGPFTFQWADGWTSPALGKVTAAGVGPLGLGEPDIGEAASQKALIFSNKGQTLVLAWENKVSKIIIPYSDADFNEKIQFSTNGKKTKITVKKTGPTDSWDDAAMELSGSGNDLNSDPKDYTDVILEDEEGFNSVSMKHGDILPRGTNAILDLHGKVMCAEPPKGPEISGELEMKVKDLPKDEVAVAAVITSGIAALLRIDAQFVNVVFKVIGAVLKVSLTITSSFMSVSTAKGLLADLKKPSFSQDRFMTVLAEQSTYFGITFEVTALHVDTSSCKMVLPKFGYGGGFVAPTLPVPKPAGWHGFLVPISPVVSISISIVLSESFTATALIASLRVAFVAVFALFAFTGSFSLSLGGLLLGGRRLGELVSGDTQVDVDVDSPPAEFLEASTTQAFESDITKAIENEKDLQGKVTADSPKITRSLDSEPKGPYTGKGWHTVCRQSAADNSVDAMGSAIEESGTLTVLECSEKCNKKGESCKGFEYRKSAGRCELHTKDICHSEEQNPKWFEHDHDFQCFIKCS